MFSFLKTGDINNNLRGLTKLPGLFTSDGDKIKYALLNHSAAMRKNLGDGAPIFTNIRQMEAELEKRDIASITSGRLPSMAANAAAAAAAAAKCSSLFADNDIRIDNAALAFIMAKELAFLNRTIQMISLIAARYQEEQEDLTWGRGVGCGGDLESGCDGAEYDDDDENDNDNDDSDAYEDDSVHTPSPGLLLQRSCSSSYRGTAPSTSTNQLSTTFLIASGRLRQRFNSLCELTGTGGDVLVNGMTTMDRPHNEANLEKQLTAQRLVIANIFLHFGAFDAEHRDPVVMAFLELRDISVSAWRIMSMFAFSNLFRLTQGTEFAIQHHPEDAIFAQGRDYCIPRQPEAAEAAEEAAEAAKEAAEAEAKALADAEAEAKAKAAADAEATAWAEMEAIEYD
jgi:hypothetical protein